MGFSEEIEDATFTAFAQFPAALYCMYGKFLRFLSKTFYLLTSKMHKNWLHSSSIKEIMQLFAIQVSCQVSGHLIQFQAIDIKHIFWKPIDLNRVVSFLEEKNLGAISEYPATMA